MVAVQSNEHTNQNLVTYRNKNIASNLKTELANENVWALWLDVWRGLANELNKVEEQESEDSSCIFSAFFSPTRSW